MRKKGISLALALGIFAVGTTGVNALEKNVTTSDELLSCIASEDKCIIGNDLTSTNVVIDAKNVTIDLNGNTLDSNIYLNNKANLIVMDSKGNGLLTYSGNTDKGKTVQVSSGSKLTLESGTINSKNQSVTTVGGNFVMNGGKITSTEMGVAYFDKSNIEINKGIIETKDNCAMGDNGTAGRGGNTVVVNGGELISNIISTGYVSCGIYNANDTTLTVKAGTKITANKGGAGIVIRGGKVTIDNQVIQDMVTGTEKGKVGDSKIIVSGKVIKDYDSKYPAKDTIDVQINYNTEAEKDSSSSLATKQENALNEEIKTIINENKISALDNVDLTDISIAAVSKEATDAETKTAVSKSTELMKDFKVGKAINIDVVVKNKDSLVTSITETTNKIPFEVNVKDLVTDDTLNYEFQIIRYHIDADGKEIVDVLSSTYDAKNKVVSFESDKFSTFLVSYKTTEKEDTSKKDISNPQTFDGIIGYIALAILSVAGLVIVGKKLSKQN